METATQSEKCTNPKCKCFTCTCGSGCTCNVSSEVVCDPCKEFKSKMDGDQKNSTGSETKADKSN